MITFGDKRDNSFEQHVQVNHDVLYIYALIHPSVWQLHPASSQKGFQVSGCAGDSPVHSLKATRSLESPGCATMACGAKHSQVRVLAE